jgi:two-component system response regulator NreC
MEEKLPVLPLSFREIQVLNLSKKGFSNKEISFQLKIELSTFKSHRYSIMKKIGLKGKAEFHKFLLSRTHENYNLPNS